MIADDVKKTLALLPASPDGPWTIETARARHEWSATLFGPPSGRADVASVDEVRAAGVTARVYRPATPSTPQPTLLWIHGGGWMTGSLDTSDILAREFAAALGAVVVSPDYRLAPEHPWPAGLDDSRAALAWVRESVDSLGGSPDLIAIGGDSAGGNLAAVLAVEERDAARHLAAQVLIYPVVDLDLDAEAYPSRTEFAAGHHLEWADVERCVQTYLPCGANSADPLISPIRTRSFDAVAPAVIATADLDPLRDEGRAYAELLRQAGVPVTYLNEAGLVHGGFDMAGVSPTARHAITSLMREAARVLARSS